MIFAVQTFVENYFSRRGLSDPDQYAVALARLYDRERGRKQTAAFLGAMKRIRTIFYRRNDQLQRDDFDAKLLALLDARFKKKVSSSSQKPSPIGLKRRDAA